MLKVIFSPAQAATRKGARTGAGKRTGAGVEAGAGVRAETEATSWLHLLDSQQIYVTQYVLYCIPEFEPLASLIEAALAAHNNLQSLVHT